MFDEGWRCFLTTSGLLFLMLVCKSAATVGRERTPEILLQEIKLELDAGKLQNHQIDLGRALAEEVVYTARLGRRDQDEDRLRLGFVDPAARAKPFAIHDETEVRRGEELALRVIAGRCCPTLERLRTEILLMPQSGVDSKGKRVLPVLLPISVKVRSIGKPADCEGRIAHSVLRAALWGTLALYLHGMFANSHFLDRQRLALRLKPLRWDGRKHDEDKQTLDVQQMVYRELQFWRRAWNWLRANPLAFGLLPGRAYHETVELVLHPTSDASQLILVPQSDLYQALGNEPDRGRGRLFVTAQRDRGFGVPENSRLGGMIRESSAIRPRGPQEGRIDLEREERLLYTAKPGKQPGLGRSGWKIV